MPCLAPLRSQEVCHIGPHRESRNTPCRSCPPNRTCRSRQSAHPYSSVGFASKCVRHPWEGTIHQRTAIWADHRRRTARVRDCAAIASLVAPCHSGEIQVRTARDCNHHQSCDPQHAMSSAEAAQPRRSSSVWALMLGPMMTARKLEKQQGQRATVAISIRWEPETHSKPGTRKGKTGSEISQDWRHDWGRRQGSHPQKMQAVRLPPVAQARRTREAFWPLYTAWTGAHRSVFGCGDLIEDAFPARIRPPPQPKRKVVEKWSLYKEATPSLLKNFLGRGDFKKFHTSFHIDLACSQVPSCGNWTLSFWAYVLTGQMENSTSSKKTYGDAVESFLHYIASEPEWEELFHLITASMDEAAKSADKIPHHGLYSELGWQVSFQQLETLLQKYYPRDPAMSRHWEATAPAQGSA